LRRVGLAVGQMGVADHARFLSPGRWVMEDAKGPGGAGGADDLSRFCPAWQRS